MNENRIQRDKTLKNRFFLLFGLMGITFSIILIKIMVVQILQESKYQQNVQGQIEQRRIVPAIRGHILDRNQQILASNRLSYSLSITPAFFPKKEKSNNLLKYISDKIKISKSDLINKITIHDQWRQNKYNPVLITNNLSESAYIEMLEHQNLFEGVHVQPLLRRWYPMQDTLAHILGYTGLISQSTWEYFQDIYASVPEENPYHSKNTRIGQLGLEKYQDEFLRGKFGLGLQLINSKGRRIPGSSKTLIDSQRGFDIHLTIDKNLQQFAKNLMQGKNGVVILTKSSTGEILALVNNPSFDSNLLIEQDKPAFDKMNDDPAKALYRRAIHGRYQPGSLFKIIVAIAALEEDLVDPEKTIICRGKLKLGNRYFKCSKAHGAVNLIQAIAKSCNVYFYHLGLQVGWETIYKWATKFKMQDIYQFEFGKTHAGILPNEQWKQQHYKEKWMKGDTLNHTIGQGFTLLTPITIHYLMSILANQGVLYHPYIINKIVDRKSKQEIKYNPKKIVKINLKETTKQILYPALRQVVTDGTAYWARFSKKYPIAGKTSTAQNIPGKLPHAWFSSYAPYSVNDSQLNQNTDVNDEKIVVTVLVEHTERGGGSVASPIATALTLHQLTKWSPKKIHRYLPVLRAKPKIKLPPNLKKKVLSTKTSTKKTKLKSEQSKTKLKLTKPKLTKPKLTKPKTKPKTKRVKAKFSQLKTKIKNN